MSACTTTSEGACRSQGEGWNYGESSKLSGWQGLPRRVLLAFFFIDRLEAEVWIYREAQAPTEVRIYMVRREWRSPNLQPLNRSQADEAGMSAVTQAAGYDRLCHSLAKNVGINFPCDRKYGQY